ncbi:MAG: NAD(P)/FAD-dependent oxidoreductase [Spirochaetota bacterium]
MQQSDHVVIIGNGITGITCALELRKYSDCQITVISAESDRFFSRPALMYVFLGHMKAEHLQPYESRFWKDQKITLARKNVTQILAAQKYVRCSDTSTISYTHLIIATGSKYNKFGWPGQDLDGVQGFYSLQDLELLEKNARHARRAAVVGGGLIGVEVAEMLVSRGIEVDFIVREKNFWDIVLPEGEAKLISRHVRSHGINLLLETELGEILPDAKGRVRAIALKNKSEEIPCDLVALTVGVSPNIEIAKKSGVDCNRGVLINRRFETNIKDVYAAGDCAEFVEPIPGRRPIEQVWYTGKAQAETLARILTNSGSEYSPGIWFNSAKFFDLEYQVYGSVPNQIPDSSGTYYWEHDSGEACLRLVWDKTSEALTGIQAIGMRLRQDVSHAWIGSKTPVSTVVSELKSAMFDPEFYRTYDSDIQSGFRKTISEELLHV